MSSEASHRICLAVQYDGGAYFGWQLQREERTVQGELERAVSRLFDRATRVIGSGRTDRGVHAIGQIASVDSPARWTPESLRRAMNALLPGEVWIAAAWSVGATFHPRYDALSRSYIYRVGLAGQTASPFHSRWCWPLRRPLDRGAMDEATRLLPGDHSFLAFAKAGQEERGDRCIVTEARWEEWPSLGLQFHISANRFLHHMVRYLVGTVVAVGLGRRPPADVGALLALEDGLLTSPPAPAEGLFLARVSYPLPPYGPDTTNATESVADLPFHI
ncbi:MAG: tRNA pseudouridine(38-40) synthase TruA [Gemmatimonadetes bacterium]|nr:tRNA pseudouridine(38-40) synthase TruA [Gemmatimonadota bacterium]